MMCLFFASGQFEVADFPALVSHLQQDGILSERQVKRLSQNGFSPLSSSTMSTQALADFLGDELKSVIETSPNSLLVTP